MQHLESSTYILGIMASSETARALTSNQVLSCIVQALEGPIRAATRLFYALPCLRSFLAMLKGI